MLARCPTCLRKERHDGEGITVLDHGGQRQPAPPAFATAWRVLLDARAEGLGVVGPCPACAMPLLAEGAASSWQLDLPSGAVEITATTDLDALAAQVDAEIPRPTRARQVYEGAMFTWLVVPFILWICAFLCFSAFLCIGVPHGAEFMPR